MAATTLGCVLRQSSLHICRSSSNFLLPSSVIILQQQREVRTAKFVVRPPTRKPWHIRKWSLKKDEYLTASNESFIQEIIQEKYTKDSPLKESPWERHPYVKGTRRAGALGLKLGVMKQWTKTGESFYVTLVQVIDNHVINYVPPEVYATYPSHKLHQGEHYGLQVIGALSCDPRQFSKPYNNLFKKAGVPPKRWLTRFLVTPNAAIQPGTPISVNHFRVGDCVDVQGRTRDYGFQGVIKRHGMKGMPASHGVTKSHRKMGSTGGGGDKDGIWKGKKMPGMMGDKLSTNYGLKIWRINTKYNVLYLHGTSIPGLPHSFVRISDTLLPTRRLKEEKAESLPMPTWFPEDVKDAFPEESWADDLYQFTDPSIELSES